MLSSRIPARFAYIATDGTPRTFPPEVLTIRGQVEISEVEGIPAEYASAARRYLGDEAARAYLDQIDRPGTRMARIDLRPSWVGVLDFQSRLPSALGGIT